MELIKSWEKMKFRPEMELDLQSNNIDRLYNPTV